MEYVIATALFVLLVAYAIWVGLWPLLWFVLLAALILAVVRRL